MVDRNMVQNPVEAETEIYAQRSFRLLSAYITGLEGKFEPGDRETAASRARAPDLRFSYVDTPRLDRGETQLGCAHDDTTEPCARSATEVQN